MNKGNVLTLATLIEGQPHADPDMGEDGFNMINFYHDCGTPSCIGGWAAALLYNDASAGLQHKVHANTSTISAGAQFLNIEEKTAYELFNPSADDLKYEDVTPAQAAHVLRNLAETGVVDWSVIK